MLVVVLLVLDNVCHQSLFIVDTKVTASIN